MAGRFILALLLAASSPAMAVEQELTMPATPGALHGTLLSPDKGPGAPAVLILAGSGPTDRDGNSSAGVHANSYKLLAEGLAAGGIASLRVDKRGIAASRSAASAESDLRFQIYADDARSWAAILRRQAGAPCIWLLGNSEGALVAEVAAEKPDGICGLLLLSGAGRKAGDVLREQLSATSEGLKQPAFTTIAELEAGRTVANPPAQLAALFRPSVQPYMISWLSLDPADILAKSKLPVLILQGDTDLQISPEDAKRLAAARPDAKLVILEGVNHVLKLAPAERAANVATYSNAALPLAPGVIDNIVQFIRSHTP